MENGYYGNNSLLTEDEEQKSMKKWKVKKRVILSMFFVIVSIIIAFLAFGDRIHEYRVQRYREKIVSYMEEKYDDKFQYVGIGGMATWQDNFTDYVLSSEKYPENDIYICLYTDHWLLPKRLEDNYMSVVYKQQFEEEVRNVAINIYGECLVWKYPSNFPSKQLSDTNLTLSEYNTLPSVNKDTYIFVNKSEKTKDTDVLSFIQSLKNHDIHTGLHILYYKELPKEAITIKNISELTKKRTMGTQIFLNDDFSYKTIEWGNVK